MSWYSEALKYRFPIAIDNNGGTASYDVEVVIPSNFSALWGNIKADGFDIKPVDVNGNLLSFERSGFNFTNKTCTLKIDAFTLTDSSVNWAWVYFGDTAAIDQSTTRSMTTPKSGQIYVGKPANFIVGPPNFSGGASASSSVFFKNSTQSNYVWFSLGNILSARVTEYNGHLQFESIKYVKISVLDSSGSVQASMSQQNKTRFIPGYVGAFVTGGTDDQNYQVRLTIYTNQEQIIVSTCTLQIRNNLPA